jgi:hypothetical protein
MSKNPVKRRTIKEKILDGIKKDKKYIDIAEELGITRWTVKKEVNKMQYNSDPRLHSAKKIQKKIQKEKYEELRSQMNHVKQNTEFEKSTGITLKEKTFRNMVEFYQEELLDALTSSNQGTVISKLPKNIKNTLKKNNIITDTSHSKELTPKAKQYLKEISHNQIEKVHVNT